MRLRTRKEVVYFILMFLTAAILWILGIIDFLNNPNLFTLTTPQGRFSFSFPVVVALFSFLLNGVAITIIRMNGVRMGPQQLPEIYQMVDKMAKKLGMREPDMYVMHGSGAINAFATVFVRRRIIVLYSETIETLTKEELSSIVAHELGHIYLRHVGFIHWFLAIAEIIVPLKLAFSRAREYSCDRVVYYLLGNTRPFKEALIKIQVGKHIGQRIKFVGYLQQARKEEGLFSWFAEKWTTHPFVPHRIAALDLFADKIQR